MIGSYCSILVVAYMCVRFVQKIIAACSLKFKQKTSAREAISLSFFLESQIRDTIVHKSRQPQPQPHAPRQRERQHSFEDIPLVVMPQSEPPLSEERQSTLYEGQEVVPYNASELRRSRYWN